ncbi:metal dependent phosphohydrolase [Mycobacteroides abscessus subsp. abscessus]|nr:metal dependent phosphohydrolase [Mycobacteroides abscessus subsp. abscessus]SID08010.1 metal dependent phosphohydrolase [Mycobacteroides abscessus subsp. abscessus]SID34982.1 metal dependent phosphohydrolase [Mycobacteroides abscessus subsp. abscessus]SID40579.1 metal dependent phosphohydrolase [Mycobacteroides abscessus subsp. abscessus]SKT66066.1 metal dependent phosphohydrolase [Mycobacteroides abscessus subsp. abscessus]
MGDNRPKPVPVTELLSTMMSGFGGLEGSLGRVNWFSVRPLWLDPDRLGETAPEPAADIATLARHISFDLLSAELPERWRHSVMVGAEARRLAQILAPGVAEIIIAAGELHDVGYASPLRQTGFHPLDGARFIHDLGLFPDSVANLVAYHSGAEYEARQRGLTEELYEFPRPPRQWLDILSAADLCTGPTGEPVDPEARLNEVLQRYEPGHPVHVAITASRSELLQTVHRIHNEVAAKAGSRSSHAIAAVQRAHSVEAIELYNLAATHGWRVLAEDPYGTTHFVCPDGVLQVIFEIPDYTVRRATLRPYDGGPALIIDNAIGDPLSTALDWIATRPGLQSDIRSENTVTAKEPIL